MPLEQLEMDVRSPKESSRERAYADLAESYDTVRELAERVASAAEYGDQDELAVAVAACVEWWRSQ